MSRQVQPLFITRLEDDLSLTQRKSSPQGFPCQLFDYGSNGHTAR